MKKSLAERFASHVDRNGPIPPHLPELGPCHIWTGALNDSGYGWFKVDHVVGSTRAQRVAFFLKHGRWPIPCALHHCDNRPCVRSDHIFEGTRGDNVADMVAKGRHGHGDGYNSPFGEAHPFAKLTDTQCAMIHTSPLSATKLARLLGVNQTTVSRIRNGDRRARR